jgi:hypothetical protein
MMEGAAGRSMPNGRARGDEGRRRRVAGWSAVGGGQLWRGRAPHPSSYRRQHGRDLSVILLPRRTGALRLWRRCCLTSATVPGASPVATATTSRSNPLTGRAPSFSRHRCRLLRRAAVPARARETLPAKLKDAGPPLYQRP